MAADSRRTEPALPPSNSSLLDALALLVALVFIAFMFNGRAPEAYMDEPFHLGQTQKFCAGKFGEWDPKITTFPGLYIVGAAYGRAVAGAQSLLGIEHQACSLAVLRGLNLIFAAVSLLLLKSIYHQLHPRAEPHFATHMALMILLLPTNIFYAFLYYTDLGSLTFLLASYLAMLKGRRHLSALAAAAAVGFRQTNAVWAAFVLMVGIMRRLLRPGREYVPSFLDAPLSRQLVSFLRLCWLNKHWLVREFWSLALVPAAFAGFAVWNRGIVVGDRSNHSPKLHLTQPLYFALFCAASLAQVHFHPRRLGDAAAWSRAKFRQNPGRALRTAGVAFVACCYVVHGYTLAHPFLLADNRHYTFYIWKDIIAPVPIARFTLIPLYLYALWSLTESLEGQRRLWTLGLAGCVAITLVPAWLLEFRYFTPGFAFLVLHMRPPVPSQLYTTIVCFAAANAAAMYVFLFRPFLWPDGSIARFMW